MVKARLSPAGEGLQVMIYLPDQKDLFARICGFFERISCRHPRSQDPHHAPRLRARHLPGAGPGQPPTAVPRHDRLDRVRTRRAAAAQDAAAAARRRPRLSRQLRHFPITPEVNILPDERGTYYVLSIVAGDRPGLLSRIARVLTAYDINLHTAKINTLGERAEDVFLIAGAALNDRRRWCASKATCRAAAYLGLSIEH